MAKVALRDDVKALLSQPKRMHINGEWKDSLSGQTFDVVNPENGELLAKVPRGNDADVNQAVAAARQAFDNGPWRTMSPSERESINYRFAQLVTEHADTLSQIESLETGKFYENTVLTNVNHDMQIVRE